MYRKIRVLYFPVIYKCLISYVCFISVVLTSVSVYDVWRSCLLVKNWSFLYFDLYRAKSENIVGFKPDHIPQSNPSDPRNKDLVPGSSDHGPKLSTADPSQTTPSSGPGSLSPSLGSQLLQTKGLLPPPRSHLGPETTSSSQEFPTGAQVDQAELLPLSDSCTDTQRSSASPAPANSPRLSRTSAQDVSGRDVETEQERQQQPLLPPPPPPPQLSSSSCMIPTADGTRSPSPQFAPLRLTDKPPAVSVQDDSPLR